MIQQLQRDQVRISSANLSEPVLLCAADDNYVRPLAVTLHSAVRHLRAGSRLQVVLLDGGISEANWNGLQETFVDLPIEINVIRPDLEDVQSLATSHHITHTAYLRLLAGRLLPDTVDRAIYLDSDVLVQDDLTELWETELGHNYCLAVPDVACPNIDFRQAGVNFKKASPYLATLSPIRNWQQLGLDPAAPYFNSGVMVLNIKRMREDRIEERLLACLRENQKFVWCWDQYALNVVFANQWQPLPARWNQGAHFFEFPSASHSPIDQQEFADALSNPAIIHYTTEWKPWDFENSHPLRTRFFDALDQTAWSGWRPEKPEFDFKYWWSQRSVDVIKWFTINYRKLVAGWASGASEAGRASRA